MSADLQDQREDEEKGEVVLTAIIAWWGYSQRKREARYEAIRHMAAVAHALYTGDTSSYQLTPTLPRKDNSTAIGWGSDE